MQEKKIQTRAHVFIFHKSKNVVLTFMRFAWRILPIFNTKICILKFKLNKIFFLKPLLECGTELHIKVVSSDFHVLLVTFFLELKSFAKATEFCVAYIRCLLVWWVWCTEPTYLKEFLTATLTGHSMAIALKPAKLLQRNCGKGKNRRSKNYKKKMWYE